MPLSLPAMTAYDPPANSEGTLDPLGLYQIADQLATMLVPAVRERMERIRFLTPMAVGALVTEGLEADPEQPDAPPFLVWEWLVIEAFVRAIDDGNRLRGVPGGRVTRRAINDLGYLQSRNYLKTPRVFGFHGVYKRLAIYLGLLDVHMGALSVCERLVDAWARDQGFGSLGGFRTTLEDWRTAVKRSLASNPCRTRSGWGKKDAWRPLAEAFVPGEAGPHERKVLKDLLHGNDERSMGALPSIWKLQAEFNDPDYSEEMLHASLSNLEPSLRALLEAVRAYEDFCRGLTDGFDRLRTWAADADLHGFDISLVAQDADFVQSIDHLRERYEVARKRLDELNGQFASLFEDRFGRFSQSLTPRETAHAVCEHHEAVQKSKSLEGKRAWFDRLSPERIYMRQQYRVPSRETEPGTYVHGYRGRPIRSFHADLL